MLGADYSTKFSPWLAAGCLSPRIIADQIKKYEGQEGANKSTYWIVFELLWRDFFSFYARKHGSRIFAETGVSRKKGVVWRKGPGAEAAFKAWMEGKTGKPLVDANMRELAKTGFMSNRGRQNGKKDKEIEREREGVFDEGGKKTEFEKLETKKLTLHSFTLSLFKTSHLPSVASFLCHSLGVDWRYGAEHFENLLNDSDTASNCEEEEEFFFFFNFSSVVESFFFSPFFFVPFKTFL